MENNYWDEKWTTFLINGEDIFNGSYEISSCGRMKSYKYEKVKGLVLNPGLTEGYNKFHSQKREKDNF